MLRMIFVLLAFVAGITISLQSAAFAACFFIWTDIFRPAAWAHYYGILGRGTFYPTHIVTAVLLLAILVRPWKRRWNFAATAILVSLGWFFLCALTAQFRDLAIAETTRTAKYFIPLALISATLCTRRAQQWFIYTLAGSVGIWLAHHGLLALMRGAPLPEMAIPGGQMSDRNDFLVAGTACLPLLVYASFFYEGPLRKWLRLGGKAAIVLSLGAFVFAESRGAIVGLAALLVWYGVLTGRVYKRLPIVMVTVLVLVALMPQFVWDRLSTIEVGADQTEASARNRMDHMATALDVTLAYPLTGVGADNFPDVSLRYSVFNAEPHSLWLKASSEYGLPMLTFFTFLVTVIFVRLRKRARLAKALGDRQGEAMSVALSCSLFGFLAAGSFTSQFLSEYMWAIIALIGAFLATPLEGTRTILDEIPEAEPVAAAT